MGKFRGSAQNYMFRGKLWSLMIRSVPSHDLITLTLTYNLLPKPVLII